MRSIAIVTFAVAAIVALGSVAGANILWFEAGAGSAWNADEGRHEVAAGTTVTVAIAADFAIESLDVGAVTVENTGNVANEGVAEVGDLNIKLTYSPFISDVQLKNGTENNIVLFGIQGRVWFDDENTPDVNESEAVNAYEPLYTFEVTAGEAGTTITIDDLIGPPALNPYGAYPLVTTISGADASGNYDAAALQLFVVDELPGCACPGDLNADGQIDLDDLQAVATVLLDAGAPFIVPVEPGDCGDLNTDAQIDLEDLQGVADILLGAGSPFIVECP